VALRIAPETIIKVLKSRRFYFVGEESDGYGKFHAEAGGDGLRRHQY
jgi:hypothetical protein